MNIKRITIIGNSVALRNRPHTKEQSLNYGQIIERTLNSNQNSELYLVNNIAFGRATMTDLHKVHDQIINSFGDLYIINIGVSDACTREMPLWFSNILNNKKKTYFTNFAQLVFNIFIKPFRKQLVVLRGKRPWLNKRKFVAKYSKIICISMNLANEKIVPGTSKNYIEYNREIERLCSEFEIDFLNLNHFKDTIHYPDGTHLSEKGNFEVAQLLLQKINKKDIF